MSKRITKADLRKKRATSTELVAPTSSSTPPPPETPLIAPEHFDIIIQTRKNFIARQKALQTMELIAGSEDEKIDIKTKLKAAEGILVYGTKHDATTALLVRAGVFSIPIDLTDDQKSAEELRALAKISSQPLQKSITGIEIS